MIGVISCPRIRIFSVSTRQKKRSRLSGLLIPAICSLLVAYFIYHGMHGRYGVSALQEMDAEATRLQYALTDVSLQRKRLAERVQLLREGTIERDILDEQARHMLGVTAQNEVVILLDQDRWR